MRLLTFSTIASVGLFVSPVWATNYDVRGETALQSYEVTSPWGDTVLERRRFTQTLTLGASHLQGEYKPGEPDYAFVMRLRLDTDFGSNDHITDGQSETSFGNGTRYVPGYAQTPFELMYGYVEGNNIAKGWLGFRLGRQYVTDVLGFWSFDGALLRVTTPYFFQTEFYGGFEQRGGLPLSSSRYESQGIWRGSHAGFGTDVAQPSLTDYPSYQYAQPAPAVGFALETAGLTWAHARATYRRVYNQGLSVTQQFPDELGGYRTVDGWRISQEKAGASGNVSISNIGGANASVSYDFYNQLIASYAGGLEARLSNRVTVGADVDYYVPTFDADSIWNWFTKSPVTTALGRTSFTITKNLDAALSGGVRLWQTDGDPSDFGEGECQAAFEEGRVSSLDQCSYGLDPTSGGVHEFSRSDDNRETTTTTDVLGNGSARYRFSTWNIGLNGMVQTGDRGHREGGELSSETWWSDKRYRLGGRVSLYNWQDPLRDDEDVTSVGYVVAGGYRPSSISDFRLEWEHDMNRIVGQRFRVVALVNLWVTP